MIFGFWLTFGFGFLNGFLIIRHERLNYHGRCNGKSQAPLNNTSHTSASSSFRKLHYMDCGFCICCRGRRSARCFLRCCVARYELVVHFDQCALAPGPRHPGLYYASGRLTLRSLDDPDALWVVNGSQTKVGPELKLTVDGPTAVTVIQH